MALDHQYPHRFTTDDAAGPDWSVLGPKLLAALKRTLRYVENTEGELGITLDSGDMARAAIAEVEGR